MVEYIYFDDEACVEAAKRQIQELRGAEIALQQKLINQYQNLSGKNIVERVLFDEQPDAGMVDSLARSMALNQRLERDYNRPFEQLLHEEYLRRKPQFSFTNAYMASAGYNGFKAEELFEKMGVGHGRVLLSKPVIMPFHAPDDICWDHRTSNPDVRLVTFAPPSKIEGLSSKLALYSKRINNAQGKERICLVPLLMLDPQVMGAVQVLRESDNHAVQTAARQLLPGLQSLIPLGMHDYVHQMILPNTDPQTMKLRTAGEDAPLDQFRVQERREMFRNNHKFRQDSEDNINTISNVYELHADLLNRDITRESFKEPRIKTHAVRMATQFLTDLETVRGELAQTRGEEFAHSFSTLMVALSIGRFLRVIEVNDKALSEPVKLRNGKEESFIEASNKLQLRPMTIDKKRALKWAKSMQLDAVIEESVEAPPPKLLQIFASNPAQFPNLGKLSETKNLPAELHFNGFENVIARGLSGAGIGLNTSALMNNFPEGNGPLLNTAKLLHDNYQVMCTDAASYGQIPDAFHEDMARYKAITKLLGKGTAQSAGKSGLNIAMQG